MRGVITGLVLAAIKSHDKLHYTVEQGSFTPAKHAKHLAASLACNPPPGNGVAVRHDDRILSFLAWRIVGLV